MKTAADNTECLARRKRQELGEPISLSRARLHNRGAAVSIDRQPPPLVFLPGFAAPQFEGTNRSSLGSTVTSMPDISRTPVMQTSSSSTTSPASLPEQVCSTPKCRSPAPDLSGHIKAAPMSANVYEPRTAGELTGLSEMTASGPSRASPFRRLLGRSGHARLSLDRCPP
jgi:hypothetical protein